MTIKRGGHTFAGVDKPIRTPNHKSGKSHAVVIKQGDGFKLIRTSAAYWADKVKWS